MCGLSIFHFQVFLLYVWQLVWTAGSMRTRHSHCKSLLSGLADLCNMQERIFETTEKKSLHLKNACFELRTGWSFN